MFFKLTQWKACFSISFGLLLTIVLTGKFILAMPQEANQPVNRNSKQESQKQDTQKEATIEPSLDDVAEAIAKKETAEKKAQSKIPKGVDRYMGRRVAQTMHFAGAEWLIRDEREREERCSLMLANLGLKPGMTVCDMGCGNGFHALQIAKMLGEQGLVVGVDVQPEMLGFLRERAEADGIENVIPILGSYHNPRLPPKAIDMVLMVDVYHEFSHPEQMLDSIRKSLKPNGLVVLVEFREEDKKVPIKPLHKMSKAQVNKELTANGFKLVKEFDRLPWQHMMFFGIDENVGNQAEQGSEKPGQGSTGDSENVDEDKQSSTNQ